MAFYNAQSVGGQTLYRVDYGKYIAGRDDYIITLDELAKKKAGIRPLESFAKQRCRLKRGR